MLIASRDLFLQRAQRRRNESNAIVALCRSRTSSLFDACIARNLLLSGIMRARYSVQDALRRTTIIVTTSSHFVG
jgi:hypothetical protein